MFRLTAILSVLCIFLLTLFLPILLLADDSKEFVIKSEDFPLKAGIVVEYKSKSNMKAIDSETVRHEYLDGAEMGGIKFIKRIAVMSNTSKQTSYFYKSDDGIIRVPTMSSNEKTLLVKLPISVGTEWVHEDFEGSLVRKSTKKAESIETISTPLGDLQCIKIRQKKEGAANDDEDFFLWVAKKYGIVQLETNKKTDSGVIAKTVLTISKYEETEETKNK